MHTPPANEGMKMPSHGLNMAAAHGATSKSRAGMNFFGPSKSKVPLGGNCNASFGSLGSSKTSKLKKLSQYFNSFGLDCKTTFSAIKTVKLKWNFRLAISTKGFKKWESKLIPSIMAWENFPINITF